MKEKTVLLKEIFICLSSFKRLETSLGKTSGKFTHFVAYFQRKEKASSEMPTESERKK